MCALHEVKEYLFKQVSHLILEYLLFTQSNNTLTVDKNVMSTQMI